MRYRVGFAVIDEWTKRVLRSASTLDLMVRSRLQQVFSLKSTSNQREECRTIPPGAGNNLRRPGLRPVTAMTMTLFLFVVGSTIAVGCSTSPDRVEEPIITDPASDELPPEVQRQQQELEQSTDPPGEQPRADAPPVEQPRAEQAPESTPSPTGEAHSGPVDQGEHGSTGHPEHDPSAPPQAEQEFVSSPDDITASQIEEFAAAYVDVMDLQFEFQHRLDSTSDAEDIAALEQRLETKSIEAVQAHDLSIGEFNGIADLLVKDEQLRDRIQEEVDTLANH